MFAVGWLRPIKQLSARKIYTTFLVVKIAVSCEKAKIEKKISAKADDLLFILRLVVHLSYWIHIKCNVFTTNRRHNQFFFHFCSNRIVLGLLVFSSIWFKSFGCGRCYTFFFLCGFQLHYSPFYAKS